MKDLIVILVCCLFLTGGCSKKAESGPSVAQEKAAPHPAPTSPVLGVKSTLDNAPQLPPPNLERSPARMPLEAPFIPKPEVINEDREFFRAMFGGLSPRDPLYKKRLFDKWNELLGGGPNVPIAGATVASEDGSELPSKALIVLKSQRKEPGSESLAQDTAKSKPSIYLNGLCVMDAIHGGPFLPELLAKRADALPPTELDLMIFTTCIEGVRELNPSTNKPLLESWIALSRSKSAMYRLLALRAALASVPQEFVDFSTEDPQFNKVTAPARFAFYKPLLSDPDPTIRAESVRAVGSLQLPDAQLAIEAFLANRSLNNSSQLIEAATEALATYRAISE